MAMDVKSRLPWCKMIVLISVYNYDVNYIALDVKCPANMLILSFGYHIRITTGYMYVVVHLLPEDMY